MPQIHTVTLNPAIDRILYLDHFQPDITNRLRDCVDGIGGKGTHVSINLQLLGLSNQALGIVHGENGSHIIQLLENCDVTVKFQHYPEQNSRMNYLLIEDNGSCTCLSSKGVQLSKTDIDSFITFLRQELHDGDYLVLSGDASNCPDAFVYNTIMEACQDKHPKIFLDTSGDTLKKCIKAKPFLIKPNKDELADLCGRTLSTEEDLICAMEEISQSGIPNIAVSLGGKGSFVRTEEGIYRAYPAKVNVRNTIGCGDCFLSGLIYGFYHNLPISRSLKLATAISGSCAESSISVGFDQKRVKELYEQIQIETQKELQII